MLFRSAITIVTIFIINSNTFYKILVRFSIRSNKFSHFWDNVKGIKII